MTENRITDPERISRQRLDEIMARGARPTIQFSKPGYSRRMLKTVNELCAEYAGDLEVRFYGHYAGAFDASVLHRLPDVQRLSVDCLMRIENEGAIAELSNLRDLSFGVYYYDRPDFLSLLNLPRITRLVLTANHKKNLDLSPLVSCESLEELFIEGHRRNIAAIAKLPTLRQLTLRSIAKRQTLEVVNEMPGLEHLTIILGGRENLDEVTHPGLRELEIIRVRGMTTLGDLSRFRRLRRLRVEDQIKLHGISFAGTALEEIYLHNCKTLERTPGLLDLKRLQVFRTSRTKLDVDELLNADWPDSMQAVAIYSGSEKWNQRARQILDEKGYGNFPDENDRRRRAVCRSFG